MVFEKPCGSRRNVNSGVDIILRLVRISGLEDRIIGRRIRALQMGEMGGSQRSDLIRDLKKWSRSSPREYKSAIKKLQMIAESHDLPRLNTIKLVGDERRIIQVAGRNSRLYCFFDDDAKMTVICVNTFWIGGGDKLTMQNKEIKEAERLINLWRNAQLVQNLTDTRIAHQG